MKSAWSQASKRGDDPAQPPAEVVFPPQIIPQGEGAFIVKPGRPISTLTPKQLADQIGANRQSIYRWLAEGTLPEALTQRAGKRKILFSAAAVEVMKRYFAALCGDCAGQPFECSPGCCDRGPVAVRTLERRANARKHRDPGLRISDFGFPSDFGLRVSDFHLLLRLRGPSLGRARDSAAAWHLCG